MELNAIEKAKGRMRIEVRGESHTLLNIIRENSWKEGAEQASYIIQHPYISHPELIVRAKDPAKTLKGAAQKMVDDGKEFSVAFKRAIKK
jgi:DNA-directed RNA polymerase subunit L